MQEQIHIDPDPAVREELEELRVVELGLEQVVERDVRAGAGHGDGPVAALDAEDAHLVAREGEVDLVPLALGVALPGHEDAAVGQVLGRVFEGAELGHPAGPLQFALVVPLLGEGHQEAFFALFVLERHHGLLDVVVVRLELLFQIGGLVSETGEGEIDRLELFVALNTSAMFGAYVNCNGIEQILVVIVASETATLLEVEDVLKSSALQLCIAHRSNVSNGAGFCVRATLVAPS